MAHVERFAKFDQALLHLREALEGEENHDYRCIMQVGLSVLGRGQRFYLPSAKYVLNQKNFASMMPLIRLPYSGIALLSDTFLDGDENRTAHLLSLACEPSFAGQNLGLPHEDFFLMSMVMVPEFGRWAFLPAIGSCGLDDSPDLIKISAFPIQGVWPTRKLSAAAELQSDLHSVTNLCVMLNLHNVATRVVEPSARLNKKRILHDRQPLYSYRVLVVDGECWDRPETAQSDEKGGVRSHLRRGHIRRLDETRCIWVRATYVHGSRPGFVDKDYAL